MLEDLRHDAVEELVVELDAALLERLLEDIVDERGVRFVARFVAREGDDRRVADPDREQREERDLDRRIGAGDAGAAAGKPGYSTSPTRTPECDIGRRRAIDDHLGAAVVHVVMGREHGNARRLEADLNVFRRGARERAQVQERRPRRRDDDARRARLQLGNALLAERPRDAKMVRDRSA